MDLTICFEPSLLFLYTEGLRIFSFVWHKFLYSKNFPRQNEWQEIDPLAGGEAVENAKLANHQHFFLPLSCLLHENDTKDEYIIHQYRLLCLDAKRSFSPHYILLQCPTDI